MDAPVDRLFPFPASRLPLSGLYLAHDLRSKGRPGRPYIYGNFITSLDGRISEPDTKDSRGPPRAIRHPHDWRLYLELAAQADALVVSGTRLRELAAASDNGWQCVPELTSGALAAWRQANGLSPHPVCIVLTATMPRITRTPSRSAPMLVITGDATNGESAEHLKAAGIEVVRTAQTRISGDTLYRILQERDYSTVYSVGGPQTLHTLASARRVDRLYLTLALRLLAGRDFNTILWGNALTPAAPFELYEMYYDTSRRELPPLLYASFDHLRERM